MTLCFCDLETRSSVPIRDGTDRYYDAPDAEVTVVEMAFDDGPVIEYDLTDPLEVPYELRKAADDPAVTFVAHNAVHDRTGMVRKLGYTAIPASRFICTRAIAYAHGLPGGLEGVAQALGLPVELQKIADGKRLIQLFCVPKKGVYVEPWDQPEEWRRFLEYARQDVVTMRAVYHRLPKHNFHGVNRQYYWLDTQINERGFAVDLPLIESASKLLERAKQRGDVDVAEQTGGAVTAITQRNKLLKYLESKGLALPNLRKAEIETTLQRDDISPETRLLLEARLEGARASGAKYKRALATHVGGRLRFTMQISGAGRTGRTAHKGFQPGNMPRAVTFNPLAVTLADQHVPMKAKFIDTVVLPAIRDGSALESYFIMGGPNTVAANALRHMIVASPGNLFYCADYKNIESRKTAWYAGEDWKLIAYNASDIGEGEDLYKLLYQRFFGGEIADINDHQRNAAKVINLACDFGGAVGAVVTMAVGYGMDLSLLPAIVLPSADPKMIAKAEKIWWKAFLAREDFDLQPEVFMACHVLVQVYRTANSKIDKLKNELGRAVKNAVEHLGSFHQVGRLKVWASKELLIVELPSGYRLCYWSPAMKSEKVMDYETGDYETRSFLTFKRARGAKMIRERTWPGLIVENVMQSSANQILRHGSLEVEKSFPGTQVLSVHDEILCDAPAGSMSVEGLCEAMCRVPAWARGMPLAAEGWSNERYGKR